MAIVRHTSRDRLLNLLPLLERAPFDVDDLQAQLAEVHLLPDSDAAEMLRQTLKELDRLRIELCLVDVEALDPDERRAHQYAMDWLELARARLMLHSLN